MVMLMLIIMVIMTMMIIILKENCDDHNGIESEATLSHGCNYDIMRDLTRLKPTRS